MAILDYEGYFMSKSINTSVKSITFKNLNTGEELKVEMNLSDDKFIARGYKMYNFGVDYLLEKLTNKEARLIISLFEKENIDYYNIFKKPFKELLPNMHPVNRSKLKRKLIENGIIAELYCKKIMLNPYIFIPIGDKNIKNSMFLIQKMWDYLIEDINKKPNGLDELMKVVFEGCKEYEESN